MALKVTLYIACSLDGYIARRDGGIDWLSMVDRSGEDYGYADFYVSVDALALGSGTYELALTFDPWPYVGKPSFVFTRRPLTSDRDDVQFLAEDVRQGLEVIAQQGFEHIWLVGGGALIHSFLQLGLVDELIVSTLPIILGDGIPLFPPPNPEVVLELVSSRQYPSGLLQAHYKTLRSSTVN